MRHDVGAVLGWKFKYPEGILTVGTKIKEWPDNLGKKPTEAQVDVWGAEYDAAVLAKKNAESDKAAKKIHDIEDSLPSWKKVKETIDATFLDEKQNDVITKMYKMIYWLVKDSDS